MLRLLRGLMVALLLLGLGVALLLWSLTDSHSKVEVAPPQTQTVVAAKQLVQQFAQQLYLSDQDFQLQLSDQQVTQLSELASYALAPLNMHAQLSGQQLLVDASIALPVPALSRYLNVQIAVNPSAGGVALGQLRVGWLRLPGPWLKRQALALLDTLSDQQAFSRLEQSVTSLSIDPQQLDLALSRDVVVALKLAQEAVNFDPPDPLVQQRVLHYYRHALLLDAQAQGDSLGHYLQGLSHEVWQQSVDASFSQELEAMLWAFSLHFTQGPFRGALGRQLGVFEALQPYRYGATLAGRNDLALHYVYSATIALAAEHGVSLAIGEFKELFDAREGGSGFSFADLAADRAGVSLAHTLDSEFAARVFVETLMQSGAEERFFPSIVGLEEGIPEAEFARRFGDVQSAAYQRLFAEIEQRILDLPAYIK
ncbi:hypothetical protein [Aliagarivorans taiwanensis]|uniref:hypothetical protein n=1 Tax=Aliagarivorans taiwanensis TaxID=561966 RepID=UPI000415C0BE|nr:hypothetical protein [Aliagarivorans taiwanensis]